MKQITYRGMKVEVEDWVNYVATDEDGDIWGYEEAPYKDRKGWLNIDGKTVPVDMSILDWEQSLEKV